MYLCKQWAGEVDDVVDAIVVRSKGIGNDVIWSTAMEEVAMDADAVAGGAPIGSGGCNGITDEGVGGCGDRIGDIGSVEVNGGCPEEADTTHFMR